MRDLKTASTEKPIEIEIVNFYSHHMKLTGFAKFY